MACCFERGNESSGSVIDSDILDRLEASSSLRISLTNAIFLCFTTRSFSHIELSYF